MASSSSKMTKSSTLQSTPSISQPDSASSQAGPPSKSTFPDNEITIAPFPLPYKSAIFFLTFLSYVMMKAANKSFSLVQPLLVEQEFFQSSLYTENSAGQTQMIGLISTLFLIVYACGQFFVGTLADRFDLRYFLSSAMVCAGIITILFSVCGYVEYHQLWVYCVLWSCNGLAQACGWPSNLTIMNNWFGKKSRGLIFSAWSSNANLGNVLGAVICGIIFATYPKDHTVWQLCMLICGLGAIVGAVPIFLFLVPRPLYEPVASSSSSAASDPDIHTEDKTHSHGGGRPTRQLIRFSSSVFPIQSSPPTVTVTSSSSSSAPSSTAATSAHSNNKDNQGKKEVTTIQEFEPQKSSKKHGNLSLMEIEEAHDEDDNDNHDHDNIYNEKMKKKSQTSPRKIKSTQIIPTDTPDHDLENGTYQERQKSSPSTVVTTAAESRSSYLRILTLGLCTRGVVPYMIIYACTKGVVYVFMYWMPLFLTSSKGISNSSAAVLSALFDLGGFIGGVSSGHITDIIGSRTLVIIFMTSTSLVVTWILFHSSVMEVWVISLALLLIGVSIGGVQVLISASVALDLGDTAVEKKSDNDDEGEGEGDGNGNHDQTSTNKNKSNERDMKSNPTKRNEPPPSGLAGTISGLIEGSGSGGAAVLQYLVGQLVTCTQEKSGENETGGVDDTDDGNENVVCSWYSILLVITASILLSLSCLLYIKFSNSLVKIWKKRF